MIKRNMITELGRILLRTFEEMNMRTHLITCLLLVGVWSSASGLPTPNPINVQRTFSGPNAHSNPAREKFSGPHSKQFRGPYPGLNPEPFPGPLPSPYPEPNAKLDPFALTKPLPGPYALPIPNPIPAPNAEAIPRPIPVASPRLDSKPKSGPNPEPSPYPRPEPSPNPNPHPIPDPKSQPSLFPADSTALWDKVASQDMVTNMMTAVTNPSNYTASNPYLQSDWMNTITDPSTMTNMTTQIYDTMSNYTNVQGVMDGVTNTMKNFWPDSPDWLSTTIGCAAQPDFWSVCLCILKIKWELVSSHFKDHLGGVFANYPQGLRCTTEEALFRRRLPRGRNNLVSSSAVHRLHLQLFTVCSEDGWLQHNRNVGKCYDEYDAMTPVHIWKISLDKAKTHVADTA